MEGSMSSSVDSNTRVGTPSTLSWSTQRIIFKFNLFQVVSRASVYTVQTANTSRVVWRRFLAAQFQVADSALCGCKQKTTITKRTSL